MSLNDLVCNDCVKHAVQQNEEIIPVFCTALSYILASPLHQQSSVAANMTPYPLCRVPNFLLVQLEMFLWQFVTLFEESC